MRNTVTVVNIAKKKNTKKQHSQQTNISRPGLEPTPFNFYFNALPIDLVSPWHYRARRRAHLLQFILNE